MIPSIATSSTGTSVNISPHDSQASPLTTDRVIKESYLKQDTLYNFRCMGHLSWIENEHIASLNGRIDFINKVASTIVETIPLRDTPITFISLGSGGLLTEYFINESLKNSGYKDLNWRIIDPDYQNNGYKQCRKEFKERINDNVMAFTTEQTYLNKPLGYGGLAENDKSRGATVVLSINPPTALADSSATVSYDPDCMLLGGMPVEDVRKANAIYLLVTQTDHKEMLNQVPHALSEGGKFFALDCALKCSINK